MIQHRDRDGNPISYEQWALLKEDRQYGRVGLSTIGRRMVSTVWLGGDDFLGNFETMVFFRRHQATPWNPMGCYRSQTLRDARIEHERMVRLVKDHGREFSVVGAARDMDEYDRRLRQFRLRKL